MLSAISITTGLHLIGFHSLSTYRPRVQGFSSPSDSLFTSADLQSLHLTLSPRVVWIEPGFWSRYFFAQLVCIRSAQLAVNDTSDTRLEGIQRPNQLLFPRIRPAVDRSPTPEMHALLPESRPPQSWAAPGQPEQALSGGTIPKTAQCQIS